MCNPSNCAPIELSNLLISAYEATQRHDGTADVSPTGQQVQQYLALSHLRSYTGGHHGTERKKCQVI